MRRLPGLGGYGTPPGKLGRNIPGLGVGPPPGPEGGGPPAPPASDPLLADTLSLDGGKLYGLETGGPERDEPCKKYTLKLN